MMPYFALPISVFLVILLANQTSAVPQDGFAIHTKGRVQVILESPVSTVDQCIGEDGFCVFNGGRCNGSITTYYNSLMDHCICCIPENKVSTVEQCTAHDGFCLPTGGRCNATIKTLYNRYNDYCICCIPERQGISSGCTARDDIRMGHQCFKVFTDKKLSWAEAKAKCEEEHLVLAEPEDSIAVELRKYILDKYGDSSHVYLGAQGTGTHLAWKSDGRAISNNDPLWWPPAQPTSSSRSDPSMCLYLVVTQSRWRNFPNQPYGSWLCSDPEYPLCEVTSE